MGKALRRARMNAHMNPKSKVGRGGVGSQPKSLPGRTPLNNWVPGAHKVAITQKRPGDARIAGYERWTDPDWALPDRPLASVKLNGVRVMNGSSCADVRPASEDPRTSPNRVVDYARKPIRHKSEGAQDRLRMSWNDKVQHGIVRE